MTSPPSFVATLRALLRASTLGLGALALSACSLVDQRATSPQPALELLQSDAVELPPQCAPMASMQVSFTVDPSGRASNVQPSSGPACAQTALMNWVKSFRYAPPALATPASVEWLLVSGKHSSPSDQPGCILPDADLHEITVTEVTTID